MNTPADILQHYRQMVAENMQAGHGWLNRHQIEAAAKVQELPLPQQRSESWRYTPLPPLLNHAFKPTASKEELVYDDDVEQLRLTDNGNPRIILWNGFFLPELSNLPQDGSIRIQSLRAALIHEDINVAKRLGELSGEQMHLFTALNTAAMGEGIHIRISAGTVLAKPLEIMHVSFSFETEYIAQPRLLIELGEGAQATLIEHYTSLADTLCLNNMVAEVFLAAGASLHHPRLQNESLRTRHLGSLYIQQAENSQYSGTTLALGGAWSRTEFHIGFKGLSAACELNGFYLAGEGQSHDMHLNVVHDLPECSSRCHFKGILHGHSKAVFDGDIEVRLGAQKTDARLNNNNLLLSRNAEIDTKPRLEIHADDVQCNHGTTVGQIDQEMLFYLRSRGISHTQAINMICSGFADEIISTCKVAGLERLARKIITHQLAEAAVRMEH